MKAQYGILRFKKYKGPAISPIEAHNERTKEQYASNPDIDTSRSRYNLHLVQPQGRYREEADRMIAAVHCRVRKDSVRVVEALVTASPEFFKDKTNREIGAYFAYALKFLEGRQCPDTFLSAVVHMDEKTPHLHLCFVPLTADGRLSAKEIIGNCEVAGRVLAAHGQAVPGAGTGRKCQPDRAGAYPAPYLQGDDPTDQAEGAVGCPAGGHHPLQRQEPCSGDQQGAGQLYPGSVQNAHRTEPLSGRLYGDRRREQTTEKEKQDVLCLAGQSEGRERLEDAKLRQDYEAALKTLDSIPPEVIRFYANRTQEPAMRHDK